MNLALAIVALLFAAGGACLIAGVYLLLGAAWALLASGGLLGAAAFYLRLRLPLNG